jgi:hypothetical protein
MNIKEYNKTNTKTVRMGEPMIRLYKKGTIVISQDAVRKIGLKTNDKIGFLHDEDKPADWYINQSNEGWKLRKHFKESDSLATNCVSIVNAIFKSLGIEANDSISCKLAVEPQMINGEKTYAILTKSFIKE